MIKIHQLFAIKLYLPVILEIGFFLCLTSCSKPSEPVGKLSMVNGQATVNLPDSSVYKGDIKNNLFHGTGELRWRNGDIYQGMFKNGLMSGKGHLQRTSGEQYSGEFKLGLYDGDGELLTSSGDKYVGEFEKGNPQGEGVFTSKSGAVYKCHFDRGKATGRGTITWSNGNSYKGEIENWRMSGEGEMKEANGTTYSGEFYDGNYSGQGVIKYETGDIYKGHFKFGLMSGKGKFTRSNGETYEGDFKNSQYDGKGELHDQYGRIYRGDFKQGEFTGLGEIIYTDGSKYAGAVKKWYPHGKGSFRYSNGTVYIGDFKQGNMEGQGVLTTTQGRIYSGSFKDNYYDGKGELVYRNGNRYVGYFKEGVFDGKGTFYYKRPKGNKNHFDGVWQDGDLVLRDGQKVESKPTKMEKLFVEETLYRQNPLINNTLKSIAAGKSGTPEMYFVSFGSYADQDVFMKEALFSRELFDKNYGTSNRSITLINNKATVDRFPVASVGNLKRTLANIGSKMNKDEDILFLFVSSHGGKNSGVSVQLGGLYLEDLSVSILSKILKESGIKWKVIVISACYSGAYIDALKDKNTMIMTSSKSDHVSFGCSDDAEFTFFGKALIKEALLQTDSFDLAFQKAKALVDTWETKEGYSHSEPQLYTASGIEHALANWRKTLRH